ncbi:MFS transporter [Embleya sp. NPDC008237]|uniref:MFS transporter n=1 Tax=Embleya sp. NPDC008237 TaxID=3363978 RepID=UPI0036EB281C
MSVPAPQPGSGPGATTRQHRTAPFGGAGRLAEEARGRMWAVVLLIVLATEVAPMQYTLVATATERIGHSFPSVGSDLSWMVIIIGLVGGATTPIIGKLADLFGKKLLLVAGTLVFLLGSVLCAVTHDWTLFLVGRAFQSTSFAITAVAASLMRDILPRKYVTIAVGALATGIGVSSLATPFLGAWLNDTWGWRAMFWLLVVYTAFILPLVIRFVPESEVRVGQSLDWVGSILLGAGAALILLYISRGQDWGWGRPSAWGYALAGVTALLVFPIRERHAKDPIIDPDLLKTPKVSMLLAVGLFSQMMVGIQGYALAYMAQTDRDVVHDGVIAGVAQEAGTTADRIAPAITFHGDITYALGFGLTALAVHLMTWQTVPSMVSGPAAGFIGRKRGLRLPYLWSLLLMTAAMGLYGFLHGSWQVLLPIGVVFGLATGLYYGTDNNLVIEAVPEKQQGIAAGMLTLAESFGASFGIAILTAILSAHPYQASLDDGSGNVSTFDIPQVFTDSGWTAGFFAATAAGVIAGTIGLFMKSGRTPATGGRPENAAEPAAKPRAETS